MSINEAINEQEEGQKIAATIDSILQQLNRKILSVAEENKIPDDAKFVIKATLTEEDNPPKDFEVPKGTTACTFSYESLDPEETTAKDFATGMGVFSDKQLAKVMMIGNSIQYKAMGSIKTQIFFEARVDNTDLGETTFDLRITTKSGLMKMLEAGFTSIYDYVEDHVAKGKGSEDETVIDLGPQQTNEDERINLRERTT